MQHDLGSWDQGAPVLVRLAFTDINGAPTDPTTITVKYQPDTGTETIVNWPSGSTIIPSVDGSNVHIVGAYQMPLILTPAGRWHGRTESTGAVASVTRWALTVEPDPLA